ncbi:thymidylate synthase [Rhizobium sp. ZPR3]|uniref:Thymidylate synthase n=2 Tax=unclassified Rhizobium TaxID=2613769 RepID=A0AAU7SET6_9HYPH
MPSYRNISFATAASVADVLQYGSEVVVRGKQTRELIERVTVLERPLERYLFLPKRHNDVFAQFAETMWVLAGRNDFAWLEGYLPRAAEYSDDGHTWRGGYGPRLRHWSGNVDQIDEVRKLLLADTVSRRAVMVLFDPGQDFVDSQDIPCNNWLSWIARDGKLHLSVAIRSNDAMWGFSGVNSFEWSILHELMAHWLGLEVGRASYFATSFHLYDRHYERGRQMVEQFHDLTPYDFGVKRLRFETSWDEFQTKLDQWFSLERVIRANPTVSLFGHGRTGDPLLDSGLALVHVRWAHERWGIDRLKSELAGLPADDYAAAMYDQLGRTYPALRDDIPQVPIANFFDACSNRTTNRPDDFKAAIKSLHSMKDRAYGSSWKRRGELVSILPNIARKSDRLETLVSTGAVMKGETMLDTAVDLLVYAEKYRLFLAESLADGILLPVGVPQPLSSHDVNFNALIDGLDLEPPDQQFQELVQDIVGHFDTCWRAAEANTGKDHRLIQAGHLAAAAGRLVAKVLNEDQVSAAKFVRAELIS